MLATRAQDRAARTGRRLPDDRVLPPTRACFRWRPWSSCSPWSSDRCLAEHPRPRRLPVHRGERHPNGDGRRAHGQLRRGPPGSLEPPAVRPRSGLVRAAHRPDRRLGHHPAAGRDGRARPSDLPDDPDLADFSCARKKASEDDPRYSTPALVGVAAAATLLCLATLYSFMSLPHGPMCSCTWPAWPSWSSRRQAEPRAVLRPRHHRVAREDRRPVRRPAPVLVASAQQMRRRA